MLLLGSEVSASVNCIGLVSCASSNIKSSAVVRVMSFPAEFDVIPTVVPERAIASPPSPIFATPFAVNVLVIVAVPLAVNAPVEIRALFMVVVPEPAPSDTVVAASPISSDVALELKIDAAEAPVIISPPVMVASPVKVRFPVFVTTN